MMIPKKRLICGMGGLFSQGFELFKSQPLDLQEKIIGVEIEHFVPDEGVCFRVNFYLKKKVVVVPLPKYAAPGQMRYVGDSFCTVIEMEVEFVLGGGLNGYEFGKHGEKFVDKNTRFLKNTDFRYCLSTLYNICGTIN